MKYLAHTPGKGKSTVMVDYVVSQLPWYKRVAYRMGWYTPFRVLNLPTQVFAEDFGAMPQWWPGDLARREAELEGDDA